MKINVVCLKSGKKYSSVYVNALRESLTDYLHLPFSFTCITDDPEGLADKVNIIPLPCDFGGWWNKLHLFNPALKLSGHTLYLDLDLVILGDITGIVEHCFLAYKFSCFRDRIDFCGNKFNSSMMMFDPAAFRWVWEGFIKDTQGITTRFQQQTDQGYLGSLIEPYFFNEDYGQVVKSYKFDILPANGLPAGTKIVDFHGNPKPHEVDHSWFNAKKYKG